LSGQQIQRIGTQLLINGHEQQPVGSGVAVEIVGNRVVGDENSVGAKPQFGPTRAAGSTSRAVR
jgi:hypothetical protein